MAIDSAEKRRSASKLLKFKPGVTPNAAKDQEWRQQAGRSYSGILAGGVVAPTVFRKMIDVHTRARIIEPRG